MKNFKIFFISYFSGILAICQAEELCNGADPSEVTYFPVKGDCSKYIECFNEVGTIFQCSEGLWWHQEILNCDYPGDYCSDDTTVTETTTTKLTTPTLTPTNTTSRSTATTTTTPWVTESTTTNRPTTIKPGNGTDPRCVDESTNYWSHPAYCHRFIECHLGFSYEMQCPPNLYFSEIQKKCVPAKESECCEFVSNCE